MTNKRVEALVQLDHLEGAAQGQARGYESPALVGDTRASLPWIVHLKRRLPRTLHGRYRNREGELRDVLFIGQTACSRP
jgi:hypothetical protein